MTDLQWLEPTCLDGYPLASADLLSARALLRRTDTKFVAAGGIIGELLHALRGRYAVLPAGDVLIATYRTLYYDTADLQCFHDHRRGRRVRHKVRVRHYDDRKVSFLEVKSRRNAATTEKARRQVPFTQEDLLEEGRGFIRGHSGIVKPFVATCRVDYRRIMLLARDVDERVTIDTGLTVHGGDQSIALPPWIIIEVKQGPGSRGSAMAQAARRLRLRPRSMSKYCLGIQVLFPEATRSRVSSQLRLDR